MLSKLIILLLVIVNIGNSNEIYSMKKSNELDLVEKVKGIGFVNINSNMDDTKIYLDEKLIGITPIEGYEVNATLQIELKAEIDSKYYSNKIVKNITIPNLSTQTYNLEFKKGEARVLLIGKDGYLFINDKFDRTLGSNNRVITIPAEDNVKIEIKNNEDRFVIMKDFHVDKFYKLIYDFNKELDQPISEAIIKAKKIKKKKTGKRKRYSSVVIMDQLIWEDNINAYKNIMLLPEGKKYCENLKLSDQMNWRMPTIEELDKLSKTKKRFKNRFSIKPYLSSTPIIDKKYVYWEYVLTKDFITGKIASKLTDSYKGSVICVKDID